MPNVTFPDGQVLGHSTNAILRLLATQHGYYPQDPIAAYNSDFLCDLFADFLKPAMWGGLLSEKDLPGKKSAVIAHWDKFLGFMEEFVAPSGKKFLCGNTLTPADFMIGALYVDFLGPNPNRPFYQEEFAALLKKHPNFVAYGERFRVENQAWIDERPPGPL